MPRPLQAPLQPVNVPTVGVAVKGTIVPLVKAALQAVPQLMPAEPLVTVPLPVPVLPTVRLNETGGWASIVTLYCAVDICFRHPVTETPKV
jgi:hypothetical protein